MGNSCVDRLQFDVPDVEGTLIVDGYISDQPVPYQVKLATLSKSTGYLNFARPVTAKKVMLFDDEGNSEEMRNQGEGIYSTDANGMRGVVGRSYHIQIELYEGNIFESEPDELTPSGTIDSIYYQYESYVPIEGSTQNGLRIFMDASNSPNNSYARFRYTGIFSLRTYPKQNRYIENNCKYQYVENSVRDPLPCSGFISKNGILQYVSPCTCCISYINEPENLPHLNDNINGTFRRMEMGYVSIDEFTFSENKYMLRVENMSLSTQAYEYWKIFRDQKEGATSLFQPAFGKAKTNIHSTNSKSEAGGFFYATSINAKVSFISLNGTTKKIPQYRTQPPEYYCALWSTGEQLYEHSSIVAPPDWDCDTCTHYIVN